MATDTLERILKIAILALLALVGAWAWYYFIGSKPRLSFSIKATGNTDAILACRWLDAQHALLLGPSKLRLCDAKTGAEKWSVDLDAISPPLRAPATVAASAAERKANNNAQFAKLAAWSADLNKRRAALKTPEEIKAFNSEAASYHAALQQARAEA